MIDRVLGKMPIPGDKRDAAEDNNATLQLKLQLQLAEQKTMQLQMQM